jgi:hypothetical protein
MKKIGLAVISSFLLAAAPASAAWMGFYFPMVFGTIWIYENADNPLDTFTESVFEIIEYEGETALRVGEDLDNHRIGFNDGQKITIYEVVENGLPIGLDQPIELAEFGDGYLWRHCVDSQCDTTLVRYWANIPAAYRTFYRIDGDPSELIVMASYDRNYGPNIHSIVVVTDLPAEVTPPAGAVTGLEWYARDVGLVALQDVDAATGGLEDLYVLVDRVVAVADPPPPTAQATLGRIHPNPFNPRTTVEFSLAQPGWAEIAVFSLSGTRLAVLARGAFAAGQHTVAWDGRDSAGRTLPSGGYLVRLTTASGSEANKVSLLK